MNYTKGEWSVTKRGAKKELMKIEGFTLSVDSPKLIIALCDREGWDHKGERLHNSHLIAASPIMHRQLKTGVEALYEALNHLNGKEIEKAKDYIKGVISGNQMALAKAEGRTQ